RASAGGRADVPDRAGLHRSSGSRERRGDPPGAGGPVADRADRGRARRRRRARRPPRPVSRWWQPPSPRAEEPLWQTGGIAAEPGGAAALAALLSGVYVPAPGERVGVVVCGGNSSAVDFGDRTTALATE